MKHVILCDIDNTISNTNAELEKRVPGFSNGIYPFPLAESFFEMNPEVFSLAEPFQGAADFLRKLANDGNRIFYVTAREEWSRTLTEQWLVDHGFPLSEPVIFTANKREVAKRIKATVGFEDSPGELNRLLDVIPKMFVHAMGYNGAYKNRFKNWNLISLG